MEIAKELQVVIKRQAEGADKSSKELVIKTKEDMVNASELFVKIKQAEKYVKDEKEKLTRGLLDSLSNIRIFFKPYETSIQNAKELLEVKMIGFQLKEEAKAQEKINKVISKVEEGNLTFEKANEKIEELEVEKRIDVSEGEVQFKTIKDYEITDEKLIPKEYWVLDLVKLRKDALSGVEIAGVKVVEKKILNTKIK